jgi:hypothetical protein
LRLAEDARSSEVYLVCRVAHSCFYDTNKLANDILRRGLGQCLGARATGNANLAGRHYQELATRKLLSIFLQQGIEGLNLSLQVGSGQPKEDDACMDEPLVEDQLAEIPIGNEQNPLLVSGDRKDILVSKTMRVVARDGRNVMAKPAKMGDQPEIGALVEQEASQQTSKSVNQQASELANSQSSKPVIPKTYASQLSTKEKKKYGTYLREDSILDIRGHSAQSGKKDHELLQEIVDSYFHKAKG